MIKKYIYSDYYVGQIFPEEIGKPDYTKFDITDRGSILFMTMKNPTTYEIQQMSSAKKRMRLSCLADIMWMTFKFGDLEWTEAPYTPHLSKWVHFPQDINTVCKDISFVLIDSTDGIVKYCEHLQYNETFIAALKTGIMLLLAQDFNKDIYDILVDMVKSKYTTKQIAEIAVAECVF
jgi:hypothetical protein